MNIFVLAKLNFIFQAEQFVTLHILYNSESSVKYGIICEVRSLEGMRHFWRGGDGEGVVVHPGITHRNEGERGENNRSRNPSRLSLECYRVVFLELRVIHRRRSGNPVPWTHPSDEYDKRRCYTQAIKEIPISCSALCGGHKVVPSTLYPGEVDLEWTQP